MSVSSYQSSLQRLTREQADAQTKIASEGAKASKLRAEAAGLRSEAARTTSSATRASRVRSAESKERDLAASERKLGELMTKKSRIDERVASAVTNLRRAETSHGDREERAAKKRRDVETTHARSLTREAERQASIQRSLPTGRLVIDFARLPESITVAFFAANPLDTDRLALDEEIRAIGERIRMSTFRDSVRLESRWAVRPLDLLQALNELAPHVVHFSGHGDGEDIVFQDDDGHSKPVSKEAIVQLMRATTDNVRLVVFNTCYSADQARAIADVIDAAIGMNTSVGDVAARVFAAQFYSAIGFGLSVAGAFEQARTAMRLEGIPEADTPELFVRPGVDANALVLVRPGELPR